jgi:hypothetical protein
MGKEYQQTRFVQPAMPISALIRQKTILCCGTVAIATV